jgi:hypothetical protein
VCTVRDVARTDTFGSFFLEPSVLWATTVRTLSETSKDHALSCMLNHGNTLVQWLHCLSLTSYQLELTLPPAAQLLLSQSQKGDLVVFLTSLREFSDSAVNHFKRETLPAVNRKDFFMNVLCIGPFAHKKTHNRTLHFGSTLLKHGRHFDYR